MNVEIRPVVGNMDVDVAGVMAQVGDMGLVVVVGVFMLVFVLCWGKGGIMACKIVEVVAE